MAVTRPLKKNGSIEIRLPDQTKAAFLLACRREGRTASDAIRTFIDDQLKRPTRTAPALGSFWRTGIAGLIGATLGLGAAAPSIAQSNQPSRSAFEELDRNRDSTLTYEEFRSSRP